MTDGTGTKMVRVVVRAVKQPRQYETVAVESALEWPLHPDAEIGDAIAQQRDLFEKLSYEVEEQVGVLNERLASAAPASAGNGHNHSGEGRVVLYRDTERGVMMYSDSDKPHCVVHGWEMKIKNGVSSKTNKPYSFWSCGGKDDSGNYCKAKVWNEDWNRILEQGADGVPF